LRKKFPKKFLRFLKILKRVFKYFYNFQKAFLAKKFCVTFQKMSFQKLFTRNFIFFGLGTAGNLFLALKYPKSFFIRSRKFVPAGPYVLQPHQPQAPGYSH
jgi:hypothetical protein